MKPIPLVFLIALAPGFAIAQELTTHGDFRQMMRTGETAGTVALDTLEAPAGWGVGATAGLQGEVVIRDGAVLVSRGNDPEARVTPPEAGEEAVILAYGSSADWREIAIPHDMVPERLTRFIEMRADALGLDPNGGFPIRVKGRFSRLVWHVVTGEASAHNHARQAGRGAGHANGRSGMNLYRDDGATGEIIGVYTGAALEGVASHPGERLHLHFVSEDGMRSGHVDEIVFPAGAMLLLPAVREITTHDSAISGD